MSSRYSVLGSCVTRDAADLGASPLPRPVEYFSRTRVQSLVSTPTPVPDDIGLDSPFQTRVVTEDHRKTALPVLAGLDHPLVIDLIDERLGLLRTPSGLVTESLHLRQSLLGDHPAYEKAPQDFELLPDGGFSRAVHELAQALSEVPRIVLHEARWATETRDGARLDNAAQSEKQNDWLQRAYEILHAAFPQAVRVVPEAEVIRADPEHRWGLAAFHYIPEYYDDVAAKIRHALVG